MATILNSTPPAGAPPRKRFQETLIFDLCERVFLLLLFIWFASRVLPSVSGQPYNMLRQESYETWKDVEITFDPRQMFGGG